MKDTMWLSKQITQNIQLLMHLHLDFSPKSDELGVVRDLWVDAFKNSIGMIDEELDAPRINEAFSVARRSLTGWPSPATILDLMPPRPQRRRVEMDHGPRTPEEKLYAARAFNIIDAVLEGRLTRKQADMLMRKSPPFTDQFAEEATKELLQEERCDTTTPSSES